MIVHASVAKLYRHLHDDEFCRVTRHIEAALEEGLNNFELEVDKLDDEIKQDLLNAFEYMSYVVNHDKDREVLEVSIE